MKYREFIVLVCIMLLSFVVRLYRINNPVADWHSWRQADTSAVSRNFIRHGFDLLHPTYDDISNVQTGVDNPKGYRFVEFPVFNLFQAGFFKLTGLWTLEIWGRLITIGSSCLTVLFIFLLGRKYANLRVGIAASLFFALDPYSIYYGRTILPDPSMSMAALSSVYFFARYLDEKKENHSSLISALLAVVSMAVSLLLKPFAIFFFLPILWIIGDRYRLKGFLQWNFWVIGIASLLPLIFWRVWMMQYPEGIPSNLWLLNGGNIRFTGSYFYWIFARRISELLLGWWGIGIVLMGVLHTKLRGYGFFLSFVIATLLYVTIVARGNVQHDYYQIPIVPTLAFMFGLGVDFMLHSAKYTNKYASYAVLGISSIFLCVFGWYQVRDFFNINNPSIMIAGAAVDQLTPQDAKVIAPLDGDTSFLYQTKRKGWPSFEHSLAEMVKLGADYLVLVNPKPEDQGIGKEYKIVANTKEYILFDLRERIKKE